MPRRTPALRRIRATVRQPLLTYLAKRNARIRELAGALRLQSMKGGAK